jgi:hypothetical protein
MADQPINSHTQKIEITEESFLRLANPEHFKYSNFVQWQEDRAHERKYKFRALLVVFLLLVGVCGFIFYAGYLGLISPDLKEGLFGSIIGAIIVTIGTISQSYFSNPSK